MDDKDKDRTVLATQYGLLCYERMSFELKNAFTTFQRTINDVSAFLEWHFAIV